MSKPTSIHGRQRPGRLADDGTHSAAAVDEAGVLFGRQHRPANPVAAGGAEMASSDPDLSLSIHRVEDFGRLGIRQGWDIRGSLRRAGMACEGLGRSESLIVTRENLAALVQELWRATNDDLIGLGPHPVPRGAIRVLAFALRSAPNLAAALKRFEEFGPA